MAGSRAITATRVARGELSIRCFMTDAFSGTLVPLLVDELIRQCHASTAEVQRALLELELDGRLERHPGNRVSLASA
jgi:DNA processing protein